jgi:hypothetical protein
MRVHKGFLRNLLLCCGAYYVSCWAGYPTIVASTPMVTAVLHSLVACATGAILACLVDSQRAISWAVFLAVLYVLFGTLSYQWTHEPSFQERLAQLLGPMIMAISCLMWSYPTSTNHGNASLGRLDLN